MALDSKVALISEKQADKATAFDYWIRLSTVKKRDPVYIPIKSNNYYENIPGNRKNFCQFNLNRDGELTISFVKDVPKDDSYIPETPKIAIDIGLSTLFATDRGNLFGRDFMHRLVYYDNRISSLAANRQRQGLPIRSPKYNRRVKEFNSFLKNEINRLLNRIITIYKPAAIVVEKIDFRKPDLSKRMNRLLSWFGKSIVKKKLESLNEKYEIEIAHVNPSYSSHQCSTCDYVDKANKIKQSVFKCKCCNTRIHADVNAARIHLVRSSDKVIDIYKSETAVLRILTGRFLSNAERTPRLYSKAKGLLPYNPYFKDYMVQSKGFL
jgi:putative transposase